MVASTLKKAIGISYMAYSAWASTAYAAEEPVVRPVKGEGIVTLIGQNPLERGDGQISFEINVTTMGLLDKWRVLGADYTAIIFNGDDKDSTRLCPFFNLKTRAYEIEEVAADIYKVTAPAQSDEIKKVIASGCIVTTPANRHKIKYLPR